MKIAKKVLAALIAIAMIAGLSAMAFAAGTPTIKVEFGEVKDGKVKANVYFDDAVGLKDWDTTISYDPSVLTYKSMGKGADAKQVEYTNGNSYTDEKNFETGAILWSGYFKENLWDSATFADDAADAEENPVNINSTHFHVITITFEVAATEAASTDLKVDVKTCTGVTLGGASATLKLKDEPAKEEEPSKVDPKPADDKKDETPAEKPTDEANPSTGNNPKTGDNMALAAAGAVVVLAGAAFVISKKRK